MNVVFFGTSEFAAIILARLVSANLLPILVVTTPDKPAGRKQVVTPSPVKQLAERYHLPVVQPTQLGLAEFSNLAKPSFKPDLFVVAAYGKMLPKEILEMPPHGTLNVHPSLLPLYRGPSPIQTAILQGDAVTGVTIMRIDEKMDHGPVIAKSKVSIASSRYTYEELRNKLAELGADLLVQTIPQWVAGSMKETPQDDTKATYTKEFTKEDGRIDWSQEAVYIERQVRALNPWPGTYTGYKNQFLKVLRAEVVPIPETYAEALPGTVIPYNKEFAVVTSKDALLVHEVQLQGKKPTAAHEFLLGYKEFINTILQ